MSTQDRYFPSVLPNDSGVKARIYKYDEASLQVRKSQQAGEKIYQPRTFIEILVKGSVDKVKRPLQEKDIERFPDAWRAYQGEDVTTPGGTPLDRLDSIADGQIVHLNARGIYTLEDLISTQPEQIRGMHVRSLQASAAAFLGIDDPNKAALNAVVKQNDLESENEALKARLEKLEAFIVMQMESVVEQQAEPVTEEVAPAKKRGRPKTANKEE